MVRKVIYWITTGFIGVMGLFAGFTYLAASQEAVTGFAHVGYPQQLRVLLGIAKPLGAIALLMPGWPRLKEWAYAGVLINIGEPSPLDSARYLLFGFAVICALGIVTANRSVQGSAVG